MAHLSALRRATRRTAPIAARLRTGAALVALTVTLGSCGGGGGVGSGSARRTVGQGGQDAAAPRVVDRTNIYSEAGPGELSATARLARPAVYVPNRRTGNVTVIDPATLRVVDVLRAGSNPQHVVPAYDLSRLWVANNAESSRAGSLTPIDPVSGKTGSDVRVDDPYNLYFTPGGEFALVVAESKARLDFRDPTSMALRYSVRTPTCAGINHMDFSADGGYLVATCENAHSLIKVDWRAGRVVQTLDLGRDALPQDVRLSPDGMTFYVADMAGDQLIGVDGEAMAVRGTIDLRASGGIGAHGIYPSRDGRLLYVADRGSAARGTGPRHGRGGVSVVDPATKQVVATWSVPGGGSPDMGGVSADGTQLWLSGRYDNEVYVFDTRNGSLTARIPVGPAGAEPHGLCVWPQPGRYSLGHTGNTR